MAEEGSLVAMLQALAGYRAIAVAYLVGLPMVTFGVGWALRRTSRRACARFLTVPVHLAVLPGICMALVVAYLVFFARENLLARYDAVVFLGPILSMVLTLVATWRVLPFDEIPGFDRLSGLVVVSGVAFSLAYLLYRLAFRVWFVASFWMLAVLFLVAFVLLRWGAKRVFGERS